MRIVIDAQAVQNNASKNRGVGRYVMEMVKSIAKISMGKHELILVINATSLSAKQDAYFAFDKLININNIKVWDWSGGDINAIAGNDVNRHIAEMMREWCIARLSPDIFWSPNLQEGWHDNTVASINKYFKINRTCVTLHDVIPLIYPEKYLASHIKEWYLEKIRNAKESDVIFTVSNFSKNEIIKHLNCNDGDVIVIENACSQDTFFKESCDINRYFDFLVNGGYIFYAGGMDEHKNLKTLFSAYAKIQEEVSNPPLLVLAGGDFLKNESALKSQLLKNGINQKNVKILGFVADSILRKLYAQCLIFVFPSYSEGFGLPPLEAMACGAPVICADAASLTEIISFDRALFPADDAKILKEKIINIISDNSFRKELIENSSRRVKEYSWERSAEKILNEFERLFHSKEDLFCKPPSLDNLIKCISSVPRVSVLNDVNLIKLAEDISFNFSPIKEKKKFYVDISTLVHADHATGIQRVTRAIGSELLKTENSDFEFSYVMSYAGHDNFYHVNQRGNRFLVPQQGKESDFAVDFSCGDILLILDLHPGSLISKNHKIKKLQLRGVFLAVVVYDLLPIEFPEYFVQELSLEFKSWLDVVALADCALCISKDVSSRLSNYFLENETVKNYFLKINNFSLGADIKNSNPSRGLPIGAAKIIESLKSADSFLMVGTVEPRKAHGFVLDAFEELWSRGFSGNLVIVGKRGWRNEELIKRLEVHEKKGIQLFWLEGISDEYLEKVYDSAKCLIAASLNEGFGLPLIEAAQHKLPIIARDIPVFREVAGEHAYYFDGLAPEDLASAIECWIALHASGQHPRSDDMPWLTWAQSAQQLLQHILPAAQPAAIAPSAAANRLPESCAAP